MAVRAPLRALRLANPLVRAVLGSRMHRMLSGRLLVLTYRGHVSGRTFRIPLSYAELPDGRVAALAVRPGRKLWWRSFRTPSRATLTIRGDSVEVRGAIVEGAARDAALTAYVARHRRTAGLARGAAIVVFGPMPG